jgi:RNA processing factor Prp31
VDPLPAEYKRKASRLVANKCSLASRLDAGHEYCDGSAGREFRAILEKKIEKMMVGSFDNFLFHIFHIYKNIY